MNAAAIASIAEVACGPSSCAAMCLREKRARNRWANGTVSDESALRSVATVVPLCVVEADLFSRFDMLIGEMEAQRVLFGGSVKVYRTYRSQDPSLAFSIIF